MCGCLHGLCCRMQKDVKAILAVNKKYKVLITAHQAFFTKEAVEQIALITIKNFTGFENTRLTHGQGFPLENEVKIEKVKHLATV